MDKAFQIKLLKPQYIVDSSFLSWIDNLSDKEKKRAYEIWRKRWLKLFECSIDFAPHGQYYNQCVRLELECYERCCYIKYPMLCFPIYANPQQEGVMMKFKIDKVSHEFLDKQWIGEVKKKVDSPYRNAYVRAGAFQLRGNGVKDIPPSFFDEYKP